MLILLCAQLFKCKQSFYHSKESTHPISINHLASKKNYENKTLEKYLKTSMNMNMSMDVEYTYVVDTCIFNIYFIIVGTSEKH